MKVIEPTFKGKSIKFWQTAIIYCRYKLSSFAPKYQSDVDLAERINYIIQNWILVEGFTKEIVWCHLDNLAMKNSSSLLDMDAAIDLRDKVKVADWKKTKLLAKEYGFDISRLIPNDMWLMICKLDEFRNGIVHSNDLQIMFGRDRGYSKPEEVEHFQSAIDHFSKAGIQMMDKEVMNSDNFENIIAEMFNSKFLNYIFEETIKYCFELLKHVDDNGWLQKQLESWLKS